MQFNHLVKSGSLRQKSLCQKHDTKSLCQQPKAIMIKSQLVVKTTNGVLILVDKVKKNTIDKFDQVVVFKSIGDISLSKV